MYRHGIAHLRRIQCAAEIRGSRTRSQRVDACLLHCLRANTIAGQYENPECSFMNKLLSSL